MKISMLFIVKSQKFFKKNRYFLCENLCWHFLKIKSVCDDNEGIEISWFINFIRKFKPVFKFIFANFKIKKIETVELVLNYVITLRFNDEKCREDTIIFSSN